MEEEFEKTGIVFGELRLTILGCFRYSLGRRTYMPSHTVKVIKEHSHLFNKQDWERFIQEIDECNNLGDECDIATWNELKDFAKKKLEKI
jgi:hypothetical protein